MKQNEEQVPPERAIMPEAFRSLSATWLAMQLDWHKASDRFREIDEPIKAAEYEAKALMLAWCNKEMVAVAKHFNSRDDLTTTGAVSIPDAPRKVITREDAERFISQYLHSAEWQGEHLIVAFEQEALIAALIGDVDQLPIPDAISEVGKMRDHWNNEARQAGRAFSDKANTAQHIVDHLRSLSPSVTVSPLVESDRVELARAIAESDITDGLLDNEDIDGLVDLFESWLERRVSPSVGVETEDTLSRLYVQEATASSPSPAPTTASETRFAAALAPCTRNQLLQMLETTTDNLKETLAELDAVRAGGRRYFCSCGGALTADEYIVHYFELGHDKGVPEIAESRAVIWLPCPDCGLPQPRYEGLCR